MMSQNMKTPLKCWLTKYNKITHKEFILDKKFDT